jgi:peptide/nickel transport system substrate-binding protein
LDRRHFLQLSAQAGVAATIGLRATHGFAQKRKDAVRVLAEGAPNSLDPHGEGVSRESLGAFTNVYDRLIAFDRKPLSPGVYQYDYTRFKGELAQSYEVVDGGRALIFHLRPDATFHDGSPVTAADVRWSLERAVTLAASKRQLATGSLTDPQQFKVLDPHTLRIDLPRADRYTLPNLALTFASVLNSNLALQHASPTDPWATAWVRGNGPLFQLSKRS